MFYFALARELGMTVCQLLNNTTALELAEWRAYFSALENMEKREKAQKMKANLRNGLTHLMNKQGT